MRKYVINIEEKINNFLRKLKNFIRRFLQENVSSGSGPGILYGLPKIHKPNFDTNFQFSPIFAAYNTPSLNLAKFLVPILNPFTCNEFTTANSHSFANDITSVEDASQFFMATFDVENLFTNFPLMKLLHLFESSFHRPFVSGNRHVT